MNPVYLVVGENALSESDEKIIGPELLVTILKKAEKPMTTRELHEESRKIIPDCAARAREWWTQGP